MNSCSTALATPYPGGKATELVRHDGTGTSSAALVMVTAARGVVRRTSREQATAKTVRVPAPRTAAWGPRPFTKGPATRTVIGSGRSWQ